MRTTKKYMLENYLNVERKSSLLDLYLFDTQNDGIEPFATEIVGSVRGQLFRPTSANGGYVVLFHIPDYGRTGNTEIHYLDDVNAALRDNHSQHTLDLRIVLERLTAARNKANAPTYQPAEVSA